MEVKKLRKQIARLLVTTTLISSTGISSLAQVINAGDLFGKKGEDYRLVTLHADAQSEFGNPLKFETVSAARTSSNASGSDALKENLTGRLVETGQAGKQTTIAVGGEEDADSESGMVGSLELAVLEDAVNAAGMARTVEADGDVEYIWLTKEGDLDSKIDWGANNSFDLSAAETHLYAATVVTVTSDALDALGGREISAIGLPADAILKVEPAAEADKKRWRI